MDRCSTPDGHLVIFDQDQGKAWAEKIFRREEMYQGQTIVVWGMEGTGYIPTRPQTKGQVCQNV